MLLLLLEDDEDVDPVGDIGVLFEFVEFVLCILCCVGVVVVVGVMDGEGELRPFTLEFEVTGEREEVAMAGDCTMEAERFELFDGVEDEDEDEDDEDVDDEEKLNVDLRKSLKVLVILLE